MIKIRKLFKDLVDSNKYASIFFRKIYFSTFGYYKLKKRNQNLLNNFDTIMFTLLPRLKQENIETWPVFGTLLGIYRDGAPINHDLDIDLGVWSDVDLEVLDRVFDSLGGFKVKSFHSESDPSVFEVTYSLNSVLIDFFIFYKNGKFVYCHDFLRDNGDRYYKARRITLPLDSFVKYVYKEVEVSIPSNINEHLSSRYGDDFMVPNPKFNTNKDNENVHYVCNDCYMRVY